MSPRARIETYSRLNKKKCCRRISRNLPKRQKFNQKPKKYDIKIKGHQKRRFNHQRVASYVLQGTKNSLIIFWEEIKRIKIKILGVGNQIIVRSNWHHNQHEQIRYFSQKITINTNSEQNFLNIESKKYPIPSSIKKELSVSQILLICHLKYFRIKNKIPSIITYDIEQEIHSKSQQQQKQQPKQQINRVQDNNILNAQQNQSSQDQSQQLSQQTQYEQQQYEQSQQHDQNYSNQAQIQQNKFVLSDQSQDSRERNYNELTHCKQCHEKLPYDYRQIYVLQEGDSCSFYDKKCWEKLESSTPADQK